MSTRLRLFVYPMNVAQHASGFIGDLSDWPGCDPVASTREALYAEAIRSISWAAIHRMRDGEPLRLCRSPLAG
jgi:hypothetical protein